MSGIKSTGFDRLQQKETSNFVFNRETHGRQHKVQGFILQVYTRVLSAELVNYDFLQPAFRWQDFEEVFGDGNGEEFTGLFDNFVHQSLELKHLAERS